MADAAAGNAHQHLGAVRLRHIGDGLAQRRAVGGQRLAVHLACARPYHEAPLCLCAAKIFASRTKPSTGISSARAVGSIPAAASSASGSTPSDFKLCRSILRRWPKRRLGDPLQRAGDRRRAARRAGSAAPPTTSPSAAARRPTAPRRTGSSPACASRPAPTAGHRSCCRARRRCARPPRAGTSAPARRTRAARARGEPADQQGGGDIVGQVGDDAARPPARVPRGSNASASPATTSSRPGIARGDLLQGGEARSIALDGDHLRARRRRAARG